MKKHLSVLVFIGAFLVSKAQQDYQITHYMFDNVSFNPGYAGMNNNIKVSFVVFDGEHGHDSFLFDSKEYSNVIERFIES